MSLDRLILSRGLSRLCLPVILAACAANSMAIDLTPDWARLVLSDQEVHYRNKPNETEGRPAPYPANWKTGGAFTHPSVVTYNNENYDLFTCGDSTCLHQEPGTHRMMQIATVVKRGLNETKGGTNQTTIWYRVSMDDGVTFDNFRPMVQDGRDAGSPFPGVITGTNGIWPGSSSIAQLRNGDVIVPVSYWPLDGTGHPTTTQLYPVNGEWKPVTSYSVNAVLIGRWTGPVGSQDMTWTLGQTVFLPENLSTRGAIEPAVAELRGEPAGRMVMITRGSNELNASNVVGKRWVSYSSNGGFSWTAPIQLCYGDGTCFYSPSSASNLVRAPNGLLYWIGNISASNPDGNSPRYPLIMGELNEECLCIVRSSVIQISGKDDTYDSADLNLSDFSVYEDQTTNPYSLLLVVKRHDTVPPAQITACETANANNPTEKEKCSIDWKLNWFRVDFAYGR